MMRTRTTIIFASVLSLALSSPFARAEEPNLLAFEAFLSNLFSFYNERSDLDLPSLSSRQIQRLAAGEAIHLVERDPRTDTEASDDTVDRVIGMRLFQHSREAVWLTALDPDVPIGEFFHDVRLEHDDAGRSRWWVYLDLPWPIADRHWVADLWKNRELSEAAQGYIWEHRWDLTEGGEEVAARMVRAGRLEGIEAEDVAQAVYLPVNRGGLLAVPYGDDQTLLIYNLSTVVGGYIPDRVVSAFSRQQVGSFLDLVDRRCATIFEHYGPAHERLFDGMGQPIQSRSRGSTDHDEATDHP